MQWTNKIQFHGQVKTAGLEKSMQWKTGHVDFDYDADSKNWKVRLFFKVNPNRASHEIVIKRSVSLALKAGRLIIDDKNGNGIHIRLTNNDMASAKALISQIEKSEPIGHIQNKAEVGLTPKSSAPNRKGSENVSPSDHTSLSLSGHDKHDGADKYHNNTPGHPTTPNQLAATNRPEKAQNARELASNHKRSLQSEEDDLEEEEGYTTPGKFTGVKDISKRAPQLCNGTASTGLGTKRFYGAQNTSSAFDHSNSRAAVSGSAVVGSFAADRSPRLKKAKLTLTDRDSYRSPSSSSSIGGGGPRRMPAMVPDQLRKSDESPRQDDDEAMQCLPRSSGDGPSQITVGFDNLGNTCFMNSPLQCLSSLEPLSIDFQTAVMEYGPELRAHSVTRLLYYLMKDVRKLDVCPERVRQILVRLRHDINGKFALNTQQDAHELLAELLDRTDEEMKSVMRTRDLPSTSPEGPASSTSKPAPSSSGTPIETNFMWFYKTSFFFHECKTEVTSQQEERDTTLMLALDSNKDSSLQDCIDRYFESSEVDMRCEKCGKEEKATMTRKIVRRPRIFILNLLRYQTDNAESKKKMDKVAISGYMSVAEYCADDVKAPPYMEPVFMLDREELINIDKTSLSCPGPSLGATGLSRGVCTGDRMSQSHYSSSASGRPKYSELEKAMHDEYSNSSLDSEPSPVHLHNSHNAPLKSFRDAFLGANPTESEDLEMETPASSLKKKLKVSKLGGQGKKSDLSCDGALEDPLDNWELVILSNKPSPREHPINLKSAKQKVHSLKLYEPLTISTIPDCSVTVQASTPTTDEMPELVRLSPFPMMPCFDEKRQDPVGRASASSLSRESRAGFPLLTGVDVLLSSTSVREKSEASLPDSLEPKLKSPVSGRSELSREARLKQEGQAPEQTDQPQSKKMVLIEPEKEDKTSDPDVKILVQALIEKFWEVEKYIREIGEDMDCLYVETRAIISEVNQFVEQTKRGVENAEDLGPTSSEDSGYSQENQMALCHTLINRALHDDTAPNELDGFLDSCDCALICKEILITRYGSYSMEDKKVNHFIEDLGLYLAAKKLGIAKPDTPKKKPSEDRCSAASADDCDRHWDSRVSAEVKSDLQLAEAGSDEEVTFKSDSAKVEPGKEEKEPSMADKDDIWDEEPDLDKDEFMKTVSSEQPGSCESALQQSEHQYFDADMPSNQLQGKDIGLYTEEELQGIDVGSLTEDEMLLYAQALSRLEYLKESRSHHCRQEDDMELSDMEDGANMEAEASQQQSEEIWINCGSESKSKNVTLAGVPQGKPVLSPSQQQQATHKKLKLICEEDLCDLDEIDGVKVTQQSKVRPKEGPGKVGTVPPLNDYPHHWSDLEASIPKYCDFCNEVFEEECITCSVMNQPGLEPGSLHAAEKDNSSSDKTDDSKQKGPRILADKCNTPPENSKLLRLLSDKDGGPLSSAVSKVPVHLPSADKSFKQSDSDHVVPSCSAQPSPKADKFLFSPSKPNNLTKSRDYSRLRSPSASPRKKNKTQVRSSSASKRLLFPGDDRGDKNEGYSYLDDGPPYHDLSRDLDTSLEVNMGESSFDTREDCFMTPVPSYTSRLGLTSSPFSPPFSKSSSSMAVAAPKTAAVRRLDPKPADPVHSSPAQVLQLNQSQAESDKDTKDVHMDSPPLKNEPAVPKDKMSENKGERIQMSGRLKSQRTSANHEEKENDPADQARSKRMDNIEVGKADFSYRLVGIVNHHGESLYAGHYTAFAYNLSKQKWFYMDDKHTKETSESIAKRESLHSGYVFFYMDKELFHEYAAKVRETADKKLT